MNYRQVVSSNMPLVHRLADWLMEQALQDTDLETIVRGCCERLSAAGIPISRAHMSFSMLHPLYRAMGFTWRRNEGLKIEGYRHLSGTDSDRFLRSPYYYLVKNGLDHLRRHLNTGSTCEFPILDELAQEGNTDYLAYVVGFEPVKGQGMIGSWSTDQDGGFTDTEIAALIELQDQLAVACKMATRMEVARSALATYLGPNAGQRVLQGNIKRGDGETIRAAVVLADMRQSTELAEKQGRQLYIETLNTFFDATAGAVVNNGGEILNFMGDGFLAIFPAAERNSRETKIACGRAFDAALEATARMSDLNGQRQSAKEDPVNFGLALHLGNVMFGNVGMAERLAFSAFGAAVHEAARLEQLTKKYETPLLASGAFQDVVGGKWVKLGVDDLRGIERPMEVYRPASLTPASKVVATIRPDTGPAFSDFENVVLLHRDKAR